MNEWTTVARLAADGALSLVILAGIFALLRRPPAFVSEFIQAQKDQAVAMTKMSDQVAEVTGRDSAKLNEMLVNDQVILRREEEILRRLEEMQRERQ